MGITFTLTLNPSEINALAKAINYEIYVSNLEKDIVTEMTMRNIFNQLNEKFHLTDKRQQL